MNTEEIRRIDQFIDCFLESLGQGYALNVPEAMRANHEDQDGWSEWIPVDSAVKPEELTFLEGKAPQLFITYLSHKCLLMTQFLVNLPQTPSDEPLKEFNQYKNMFETDAFYSSNSLFPFAMDSNDGGIVCFDYSQKEIGYPIVLVDSWTRIPQKKWEDFGDLLDAIEENLKSYM